MVDLKISILDYKRGAIQTVRTRGEMFSYVPSLLKPCGVKSFHPYLAKMTPEVGYEEFNTNRIAGNALSGRKAAFLSNKGLVNLIGMLLGDEEFLTQNPKFLKFSQECHKFLMQEDKKIKAGNIENHDYLALPSTPTIIREKGATQEKIEDRSFTTLMSEALDCSIQMTVINGEPWFLSRDVCETLGYKNVRDAISKHVRTKHKGVAKRDTLGGSQSVSVINESGLYSLVLRSKAPNADSFQDWIVEDVLPSIRKTGGFGKPEVSFDNPDSVLALAQDWHRTKQQVLTLENKIEEDKEKVAIGEAMIHEDKIYTIRFIADVMAQMGVKNMTPVNLSNYFIGKRYISKMKKDETYHQTCAKARKSGLFKIVNKKGKLMTMITGKGLKHLCRSFALDNSQMEKTIERMKQESISL